MIFIGASGEAACVVFRLVDDDTGEPITDKGTTGDAWNDTGAGATDELYAYTAADGAFVETTILDIENLGRGFYRVEVDASVAGLVVIEHSVTGASPFSTSERVVDPASLASAVWDAVSEVASEGNVTYGDAIRGLSSFAMGIASGFMTGTIAFKALDGVKTRFTIVRTALGRISKVLNDLTP